MRSVVKGAAAVADTLLPRHPGVVVLIYHRVGGGTDGQVDLDPAEFDRQLAHLAAEHTVLPLGDAVDALTRGDDVTGVVLTFDDGTADFAEHAVPALARHRLPATLYVATRFVDEQTDFPWGAPPASWAALRDTASTGLVTFGSHTHSHWLLDRLDAGSIDDDLDRSIDLIGTNLGVAPAHFAYPKALPGSVAAEVAVRRRFRSAALAASRVNRPGHTDVHRLWRTPVQRSDGFRWFAAKARGGLRLEGELRAMAARVRYRGTTR